MPALPIPLDVLRTRLKIEVEQDDVDLAVLCIAAGEMIERETGLGLQSLTRIEHRKKFERFIPRVQPMTSVSSVHYRNAANVRTALPTTDWYLDESEPLLALEFDTSVVPL
jgi:hypothetical protein